MRLRLHVGVVFGKSSEKWDMVNAILLPSHEGFLSEVLAGLAGLVRFNSR